MRPQMLNICEKQVYYSDTSYLINHHTQGVSVKKTVSCPLCPVLLNHPLTFLYCWTYGSLKRDKVNVSLKSLTSIGCSIHLCLCCRVHNFLEIWIPRWKSYLCWKLTFALSVTLTPQNHRFDGSFGHFLASVSEYAGVQLGNIVLIYVFALPILVEIHQPVDKKVRVW